MVGHPGPSTLQTPPVLIASGSALMRAGLRALLSDDFTVVREATDLTGALAAARRDPPALTLIDTGLSGGVVRAVHGIVAEDLGRVVLFSTTEEPFDDLLRALRAGASGYVAVDKGFERLAATLHGVLRGEAALPRAAVGELLAEFQARPGRELMLPGQHRVHLTQREQEVLRLLRSGCSTTQIGHRLGVAPVTVRSHILALKQKLRSESRQDLIDMKLPGLRGLSPRLSR